MSDKRTGSVKTIDVVSHNVSTSITKTHVPGGPSTVGRIWTGLLELPPFVFRTIREILRMPWDTEEISYQVYAVGWRSTPLILAAGIVVGIVIAELIGRSLENVVAVDSVIPAELSRMMFREMAPLMTGLLISGRVGSAIGAELAVLRLTEQIDALESLAIDSFRYLVVTRVVACVIAMPILTTLMSFAEIAGGYLWEAANREMSFALYSSRVFEKVGWGDYILPTLLSAVSGFVVGTISSFFGYEVEENAAGLRRASMYSVVFSSLFVVAANLILNQTILFWMLGKTQ